MTRVPGWYSAKLLDHEDHDSLLEPSSRAVVINSSAIVSRFVVLFAIRLGESRSASANEVTREAPLGEFRVARVNAGTRADSEVLLAEGRGLLLFCSACVLLFLHNGSVGIIGAVLSCGAR